MRGVERMVNWGSLAGEVGEDNHSESPGVVRREAIAGTKIYFVQCLVPLPETLLRMLLPLPGKIVTTDVSQIEAGSV